jgi:hypothetical protein
MRVIMMMLPFGPVLACSGGGGESTAPPTHQAANSVDAGFTCGKAGDQGNAIGVGKYCDTSNDCSSNTKATLCATLGEPGAHFCTTICSAGDDAACGDGASCKCLGGQCGCMPNHCQ